MLHRVSERWSIVLKRQYLRALVEYAFNSFLQPFAVRLLTAHQQLHSSLEWSFVWKFSFKHRDYDLSVIST